MADFDLMQAVKKAYNAEVQGTADTKVSAHSSGTNVHTIQGTTGLQSALDSKYSSTNKPTLIELGQEAQGATTAHEQKQNAHPISGISGMAQFIDTIMPPLGSIEWGQLRTSIRPGYVVSDGQLLSRNEYPDLWALIFAGKVPVVTDAQWLADPYKRASFTQGNGTTTFRIPDYNGKYAGSIGALFLRGDGLNSAGTNGIIQGDAIRNIKGKSVFSSSNFMWAPYSKPGGTGALIHTNTNGSSFKDPGESAAGVQSRDADTIEFDASKSVPTAEDNHPVSATGCWILKSKKSSTVAGL